MNKTKRLLLRNFNYSSLAVSDMFVQNFRIYH